MYSFLIICIILGIQLNVTVADSQVGDDFIAELSSCHEFTLRPVDLAKLLVIRNKKINKKKARLFEQMGLSNVTENTTSKKIFISKQNKLTKSTINKTAGSKGNIY
jgi:propanediol dehydratase large subunit